MESINTLKFRADEIGKKVKALLAYTIMTAAASLFVTQGHAQTFAEWFSQKKTQKKYLLQQIAALQVYSGYLKQGYDIANGGLGYITGSLKAEFNLHAAYYDKLMSVNSAVKDNPKVKNILIWQQDILSLLSDMDKLQYLTPDEKSYLGKVKKALLADCDQQITALSSLLSYGKLKMKDDEQLERLNTIYQAMQSNFHFAADFKRKVIVYGLQKAQERSSLSSSKYIFGIK